MILIDTGVLVALCDDGDGLHTRAWGDLRRLGTGPFAVCESVLVETCFHLVRTDLRAGLVQLLEHLKPAVMDVMGADALWPEVFGWLDRYAEHAPEWTDAYLVALSAEDRTARVWTYDQEFRTIWRRPDGSAVPMAVD